MAKTKSVSLTEYNNLLGAYLKATALLHDPARESQELKAHIKHLEEEMGIMRRQYEFVCAQLKEIA